jgi:glycosyltransferase involved in cell wall biosynthesis
MIDVLIPLLNGDKYIKRAIESVLSQPYLNSIIVIDNGSVDRSVEVVAEMEQVSSKVVLLHEPKRGISNALNCGIAHSNAPFIARLDSDDLMKPGRLSIQYLYLMEHNDCDVVATQIEYIDQDNHVLGQSKYRITNRVSPTLLGMRNPLAHPSVLVRTSNKEWIKGYRPYFDGAEDLDMWIRISKNANIAVLRQILTSYRVHDMQVSSTENLVGKERALRMLYFFHPIKSNSPNYLFYIFNFVRIIDLTIFANPKLRSKIKKSLRLIGIWN